MPIQKPGTAAAIKLYKSDDPKKWTSYLTQYNKTVKLTADCKNEHELVHLDNWLWCKLNKKVYSRFKKKGAFYLKKSELSDIMTWKLSRGKFRPLQKLVDSNSVESVKLCTGKALDILCNEENDKFDDWKAALKELITLKGIGVATASIVLAVFSPIHCPFMSDEVIESVHDGKLDYTNSVYLSIQSKLTNKMEILNANKSEVIWDVEMMGKALWATSMLHY